MSSRWAVAGGAALVVAAFLGLAWQSPTRPVGATAPTASSGVPTAALALRLTARQWGTADAVMDNVGQQAVDGGGDPEPAARIRQAGWNQVPWVGAARAWPPDDQILTITPERQQWEMIVADLIASEPVVAGIGDDTSLALERDVRAAISRQLR